MTTENPNANETTQEFFEYTGEGGKKFNLPLEFKDELNKRLGIEKGKIEKMYDSKIQDIVAETEKTKAELLEIKKAAMTDKERADFDRKAKEDEFIKLQQRSDANWKLYSDTMTSKALYDSISKYDVYNPKQIEMLLRTVAKADVDEKGNVIFDYDGKKISADEMVTTFLTDASNANLLKSRIIPGGGTQRNNTGASGSQSQTYTREQMKDPKIAAEYRQRLSNRENVSITE